MTENVKDIQKELQGSINNLIEAYAKVFHSPKEFVPGTSPVQVAGSVHDAAEMKNLADVMLKFWLAEGEYTEEFQRKFSNYLGVNHTVCTNSGSSANLLAFSALTSHTLGDRALKPGDEVITCATGFPTTVNPTLQYGLVPVFIDVDLPTYNIKAERIEAAISEKTKAIMVAHTLGNPFDLDAVMAVAKKHNLWVIEDCCDAFGSTYNGQKVGTFGDIATCSFYSAHHIMMGEGGAVFTNSSKLKKLIESFRDWGRDCYCSPGCDNTCGMRFDQQLGSLPKGFDHKYTYSHAGYNLKLTDMQASVGVAQLDKADDFVAARKRNFAYLKEGLAALEEFLILPEATKNSDPSWFGFPITLREDCPIERPELIRHLDSQKIATRMLFAGNLIRQPYFEDREYRVVGDLSNSDLIMNNTFWIGVYPGLTTEMLDHVISTMKQYFMVD
ncbi:MAG: lipopolysaccharide biosynthesis protein RfbH [Thiotrichales bacterium]